MVLKKKTKTSHKTIKIVGIIFILIAIALIGSVLTEKTEPKPSVTNQQKTELSEKEAIDAIITGEIEEPPKYMNTTKKMIIRQYLADCYDSKDFETKKECYEFYYNHNLESIKEKKNECDLNPGNQDCLDDYYVKLSKQNNIFCEEIINKTKKNECQGNE